MRLPIFTDKKLYNKLLIFTDDDLTALRMAAKDNENKAFLKGIAVGVILGFMLALLIIALTY